MNKHDFDDIMETFCMPNNTKLILILYYQCVTSDNLVINMCSGQALLYFPVVV